LGGALRQGGISAAACLYALDHHVERLAEDHANARALASGLSQIPGLAVEPPETNLVFFDTEGVGQTAAALAARLRAEGVLVSTMGRTRMRVCTHLDVTRADVEEAVAILRRILAE
jgi:threonine aldolase